MHVEDKLILKTNRQSLDSKHAKGIFIIILDLIANIDIAVIMCMLTCLYVQKRDNSMKNLFEWHISLP
jgi:hypothetical protein